MIDSANTLMTVKDRLEYFMKAADSEDMKQSKQAFRLFADHLEVFNFGYPIVHINRYGTGQHIGLHVVLTTEKVPGYPMSRTVGLVSPETASMITVLAAKLDDRELVSRTWADLSEEQKDWMINVSTLLPIEWKSREVMDRPEMAESVIVYFDWEPAIGDASPSDFFAKEGEVDVMDQVRLRKPIVDVPLPPAEHEVTGKVFSEPTSFNGMTVVSLDEV